jgi:thiol-disulfide isomerase/thioredoxin
MPSLDGATGWLNTAPLTSEGLRGRVVLVDFWTYTCINWRRTLPHLRAWAAKYEPAGLVVLGVHTPEFSFEHDPGNVAEQVAEMDIAYPVALDSRYAVWEAFANHYWPALYAVDATGRIRHHQFGEGDFAHAEMVLRRLLAENGADLSAEPLVTVAATGAEVAADWDTLMSGETYLGVARATGSASTPDLDPEAAREYEGPAELPLNRWALTGRWRAGFEAVTLEGGTGSLTHRFSARDLHLVAGPAPGSGPVGFTVRLDGRPPGADAGVDVDADGRGRLDRSRMYQLVRRRGRVGARTFEITFDGPGARLCAVTFG